MFAWPRSEWRICNAIANKISRLWILTEGKIIVNAEAITTEAVVDLVKGETGCNKHSNNQNREWKLTASIIEKS
jgi:hypothetical protein